MGLFDIFSNDTAEKAAQMRNDGLQAGYGQLSDLYGQGRDALNTNYSQGIQGFQNLAGLGANGAAAYGDASGANGAAGLQKATDNFKNSGQYGAYGFSLDQGLQALNRTHAAAGNLNSGNADTDAMKYASGLAGQQYNSYLQGLSPYLTQQTAASTSAANGIGSLSAGLGNQLNSNLTGQGTAANATQTGIGASNAAAEMNNYNVSKNMWDGIGKAVNIGSSLFGMF